MLQIRGVGSAWSVCSDPTLERYPDMSGGQSDPNQDPLGDSYHVSRRAPVRYASRSASMVESTLDPPIVSLHVTYGSV